MNSYDLGSREDHPLLCEMPLVSSGATMGREWSVESLPFEQWATVEQRVDLGSLPFLAWNEWDDVPSFLGTNKRASSR